MSAQTETQEAEVQSDGPLLDLTDAGVKKFIKQAKARGYVTMEDLNKVLPSEEVTPDAIEDTLAMLSEMGVNVVEAEEDAEQKEGEGGEVAERADTSVAETPAKAAYDRTAQVLVGQFIDNFAQFAEHVDEGVRQAAPQQAAVAA